MKTKDIVSIALFVALFAVSSYIKIPIFIVPMTLQYTTINTASLFLKKNHGTIAVGFYVVLGLLGLPVFASGAGISYVLRPGFGYLLGFLALSFVTPRMFCFFKKRLSGTLAFIVATVIGWLLLYIIAVPYCAFIMMYVMHTPLSIGQLLLTFFIPFIPSDIASMVLSYFLVKQLSKHINLNTKSMPSF